MLQNPVIMTIILECLALLIMKERDALFYVYWAAITTVTNIPANLYIAYVFSGGRVEYWISVAVIEALVLGAEYLLALAYTKDKKRSIKYSAICNLTSYCIGSMILIIL